MAKAVASGIPKLEIEKSAAKRQARIDSNQGLELNFLLLIMYILLKVLNVVKCLLYTLFK